jgi:Right handed beta helix region
MTRVHSITILSAVALIATAGLLVAGPLDPPAGLVTSTYKTLTEVEPRVAINATNTPGDADSSFKIAAPGSYYLTRNMVGGAGKHGMEIASGGVTLDLNGFEIVGFPGTLSGIHTTASLARGITVRNGTVRNWGADGVDLVSGSPFQCRVEGVHAISNGGAGIRTGSASVVIDCTAAANGGIGFDLVTACVVSSCTATLNGGHGFDLGQNCTITNSTSSLNTLGGFEADGGTTFTACSGTTNGTFGFLVGNISTVTACVARANGSDGILLGTGCTALGNTASANGASAIGVNIRATGPDNRIEGNNCSGADVGIRADVAGSFIIKNTCTGATVNWDIVANNVVGPILDRTAPASAAVNGNAAPSSLGSTDSNANFTY